MRLPFHQSSWKSRWQVEFLSELGVPMSNLRAEDSDAKL